MDQCYIVSHVSHDRLLLTVIAGTVSYLLFFASDEDITEMRYFKKTMVQICLKGRDGWMKHQEIKH